MSGMWWCRATLQTYVELGEKRAARKKQAIQKMYTLYLSFSSNHHMHHHCPRSNWTRKSWAWRNTGSISKPSYKKVWVCYIPQLQRSALSNTGKEISLLDCVNFKVQSNRQQATVGGKRRGIQPAGSYLAHRLSPERPRNISILCTRLSMKESLHSRLSPFRGMNR